MKGKCLLVKNGFVFDFCEKEQLHTKWCHHYRRVNNRYRLVNHFANALVLYDTIHSPICFDYFSENRFGRTVRIYTSQNSFSIEIFPLHVTHRPSTQLFHCFFLFYFVFFLFPLSSFSHWNRHSKNKIKVQHTEIYRICCKKIKQSRKLRCVSSVHKIVSRLDCVFIVYVNGN